MVQQDTSGIPHLDKNAVGMDDLSTHRVDSHSDDEKAASSEEPNRGTDREPVIQTGKDVSACE